LTDWCACSSARLIDLDDQSFARLAKLSAGVVKITITLGKPVPKPAPLPTGPPTDTD